MQWHDLSGPVIRRGSLPLTDAYNQLAVNWKFPDARAPTGPCEVIYLAVIRKQY